MSTESGFFLNSINQAPDDDARRLIFADWLEEKGNNDRAEFIRAQIRLAALRPWDEAFTAFDIRCRQLERAHPEWLGLLQPFVKRTERFCGDRDRPFDRGFPWRVELTPRQFSEHRKYLFQETPVREVRLAMNQGVGHLTTHPELPQLSAVEFAYVRDSAITQSVLACLKRLGALRHFGLIGCDIPEMEVGEILSAPALDDVSSLSVMGTQLSPLAEETLAARIWSRLRRLKRVWVSQLDWLRSPWVSQLEKLTIYDTEPNLSAADTRQLADVLPTTAVRQLELGSWAMDVPGAQALGEAIAKSSVRSLALSQTSMSADIARALVTSQFVSGLNALYFSWATLDSEVVSRLLGSGLRVCALDHVTIETLSALQVTPGLPHLADLRLGLVWSQPGDAFAERLCAILEAGMLPRLRSLTLCDTTPHQRTTAANIDRIASMLAKCPASAELRELQMGSVTRTGALELANSPYLDSLQVLNVRIWPQDADAELALRHRFGDRIFLEIVGREY